MDIFVPQFIRKINSGYGISNVQSQDTHQMNVVGQQTLSSQHDWPNWNNWDMIFKEWLVKKFDL